MKKAIRPFHRRTDLGESFRAHELFMVYASMGPSRSLPAMVENRKNAGTFSVYSAERYRKLVGNLCTRFRWVSRAIAYDEYLLKLQFKAIDKSVKDDAVLWAERIRDYRNESYLDAIELDKKADEMLAWPIAETRVDKLEQITVNGETIEVATHVTQTPVKWTRKDAIAFKEFADKKRRLALEVPTERKLFDFNFSESDDDVRLQNAVGIFQMMVKSILEESANNAALDSDSAIEAVRQDLSKYWKIAPEMLVAPVAELEGLTLEALEM